MLVKSNLKAAKQALGLRDADTALYYTDHVIEEDPHNYYAHVFAGKACEELGKWGLAADWYRKATAIEPHTLLAWKGYFLLVANSLTIPYFRDLLTPAERCRLFFHVADLYVEELVYNGEPVLETVREIVQFMKKLEKESRYQELHEIYLENTVPGTRLYEHCGLLLGPGPKRLHDLVAKHLVVREREQAATVFGKAKLQFLALLTVAQLHAANERVWDEVFVDSTVRTRYRLLVSITDDDEARRAYEVEFLRYLHEFVLRYAPPANDIQSLVRNEVWELAMGMVVVSHPHPLPWSIYWDWCDPSTLGALDPGYLRKYIALFNQEGLGQVLYAFVKSDISPYDPTKVLDEEPVQLAPGEILSTLLEGHKKCADLVLASRIMLAYYLHLQEYEAALAKTKGAVGALAGLQRSCGLQLPHTKEELLVNLGLVYTYYEAPKNYPRAIQLFDGVLKDNPHNVDARIGKGLILVETGNQEQALVLLDAVVAEHPTNPRAVLERSWCQIQLGRHAEGREGLARLLDRLSNTNDLKLFEQRALIFWRLAQSHLLEAAVDAANVDIANDLLLQCLQVLRYYAPAYTLLGLVYRNYLGDPARAQRCFYRAFELDAGEVEAGRLLVEPFCDAGEWELAAVLCQRLVDLEKARRLLPVKYPSDTCWPYRVLGTASLDQDDNARAVEWFQLALRLLPRDALLWVGLGEAYAGAGRVELSIKVFNHALEIAPADWHALYCLAGALSKIGAHGPAIEHYKQLLQAAPPLFLTCVRLALADAYLALASGYVAGGFLGRGADAAAAAASEALAVLAATDYASPALWLVLVVVVRIMLGVQKYQDRVDVEAMVAAVKQAPEIQAVPAEVESAIPPLAAGPPLGTLLLHLARAGVVSLPASSSKPLVLAAMFNLGLVFWDAQALAAAGMAALRKALVHELQLPAVWTALGNAAQQHSPRLAQHCYIRAAALAPQDPAVWTNLAVLFLRHGDQVLAREAFQRSQLLAPDQLLAWLGQAVAEELGGSPAQARPMYLHGFVVANGATPVALLLYGHSVLGADRVDPLAVASALHALDTYLALYPQDTAALELAGLALERCGAYAQGCVYAERLCGLLASAAPRAQLARMCLGRGEYQQALDWAGAAAEASPEGPHAHTARVVAGLAYFFNDMFDEALEQLQALLEAAPESDRLVVLVAQVLYAQGRADTRTAAMEQLLAHIQEHGLLLLVVLAVGALAVVEGISDYLPAVCQELAGLPLDQLAQDTLRAVPAMVEVIGARLGLEPRLWQRAAAMFPHSAQVWAHLSSVCSGAVAAVDTLEPAALAATYVAGRRLREVQRAVFLSPSASTFLALAGVPSQ